MLAAGSAVVAGTLAVVGTHAMASTGGASTATGSVAAGNATAKAGSWKLMWHPDAAKDGLGAFEGVEDDRSGSHPGVKHIYVKDGAYRFDMHLKDRDGSDRQRNEVKGMSAAGQDLKILRGQTWRFTYSMYIPSSLHATTSFTHIMQFKEPGGGTSPIIVMSLRQSGGKPTIELNSALSGKIVGRTPLTPLQDKWISTQLDITFKDGTGGKIDWTVNDGSTTVANASASGLDTWLGPERARPKWGIYRSLKDHANLRDTYLLIKDVKAYQQQ
ncbi:FHA domain-containing protein [Streptomyces sp. YIM S03343]